MLLTFHTIMASSSLKQVWRDYGVIGLLLLAVGAYAVSLLMARFFGAPKGSERMSGNDNSAYYASGGGSGSGPSAPAPSSAIEEPSYGSATGMSDGNTMRTGCGSTLEPSELLPKNSSGDDGWSEMNPMSQLGADGMGEIKTGYSIGLVSSSNRNPNMQPWRSDPPIRMVDTGPWNQSTISRDEPSGLA